MSSSVSNVTGDSWFPMDSCLQLNSLVLNNVQMPITASLALGEVIMIHSHIKCLVSHLILPEPFLQWRHTHCMSLPERDLFSWLELSVSSKTRVEWQQNRASLPAGSKPLENSKRIHLYCKEVNWEWKYFSLCTTFNENFSSPLPLFPVTSHLWRHRPDRWQKKSSCFCYYLDIEHLNKC